jgi:hypothetical protein
VSGFDPATLEAMRGARSVRIETTRGPGSAVHETIIWIVVDPADRVFVRSERAERGRWYRELRANPAGAVHVGSIRIPIRAEHAADHERVAACSRALSAKYASSRGSLATMLRDEVLEATLELHPA